MLELILLLILVILVALIGPLFTKLPAASQRKIGGSAAPNKKSKKVTPIQSKLRHKPRHKSEGSFADFPNALVYGGGVENEDITYTPYYDITLTREILKRCPALGEIIKSSPICPHVSMIPHRMTPERIKRMVHCGHTSAPLHDFAIAAQFLSDFRKDSVCIVFGEPACDPALFTKIADIPYVFIGGVKISAQSTKNYMELTEDVIASIDNVSAQYFVIERISRLDLLAKLAAKRIILAFDRQPVEALLLSAPHAWCYPSKTTSGFLHAKSILTPPFGRRGKLEPYVYVERGANRQFDAVEIREKLFYYDVCMRGYGKHKTKCIGISRFDHCGDCAIFCYACEYAGIKITEKFIDKIDPYFGTNQLSHIPNDYDDVSSLMDDIKRRVHSYIYSKISLNHLRQINLTVSRAWAHYNTRKILTELYGKKADEIMRCIIFGAHVGFHIASLDNLYYLLLAVGLEIDTGGIIKNSFTLVENKIKYSQSNGKISIEDLNIEQPKCFSKISWETYLTGYLAYPQDRPTLYNDKNFIEVVKKSMEKYNCTSLHVISYHELISISLPATHYYVSAGQEIPVKFPDNSMVVFISHEINKSIKMLYNSIWTVNKIPFIIINYESNHDRHSLKWLYKSAGKQTISLNIKSVNTLGKEETYPISMIFNIIDSTFITTILDGLAH